MTLREGSMTVDFFTLDIQHPTKKDVYMDDKSSEWLEVPAIEMEMTYDMTYDEYIALLCQPITGEVIGGRYDGLKVQYRPKTA